MSMFSNILEALGFGKEDPAAPKPHASAASTSGANHTIDGSTASEPHTLEPGLTNPETMKMVDVVAKLEALASAHPEKLNWKTSIVDLLKLLGLDSSYGARKELAAELNCPADKMEDSAQMNMWLHKTVLQKLADNGGNIPADLLD